MVIGFICNCVKRWMCEGWPANRNGKIFWVVVYIVVNMVTFGIGGMIWLAVYICRRYGWCSSLVGTVGKEISFSRTQFKAYVRIVHMMDAALLKRSK